LDGDVVRRIVHRDVERLALLADATHENRNEAVSLGHIARHQVEQRARKVDVIQRHPRDAELAGQRLDNLDLANEAELHEELPELASVLSLRKKCLLQLRLGEESPVDEELPDPLGHAGIVRYVA
jgi:hypothetical protein